MNTIAIVCAHGSCAALMHCPHAQPIAGLGDAQRRTHFKRFALQTLFHRKNPRRFGWQFVAAQITHDEKLLVACALADSPSQWGPRLRPNGHVHQTRPHRAHPQMPRHRQSVRGIASISSPQSYCAICQIHNAWPQMARMHTLRPALAIAAMR